MENSRKTTATTMAIMILAMILAMTRLVSFRTGVAAMTPDDPVGSHAVPFH